VIRLDRDALSADRAQIFAALRAEGIGVNVHYLPVHLHPFYRERFGLRPGCCPNAEAAYEDILSLPLFPSMSDEDIENVIEAVWKVISAYAVDTRAAAAAGSRWVTAREALERLAEGSPRLNGAFSRAQGAPIALSGIPAALVGRNHGHETLYSDDTLDCWTSGSVAAATLRREFCASAIASPPRHCAGAKPCW
jgi:hypothetical protein